MFILSFDCGINNLAWSIIKINDSNQSVSIYDWGIIDLLHNTCKKKLKFSQYNEILISILLKNFTHLDKENNNLDSIIPFFNYILIENQSVISPQNKNISVIIYTFFLTCNNISEHQSDIRFISPNNKFKLNNKPILPDFNTNDKYRIRKRISVIYTKYYLEKILNDSVHLDQLTNHKKQDDLSDSLLQAIYFIENILNIKITSPLDLLPAPNNTN